MKKLLTLLMTLGVLFAVSAYGQTDTLVILHTNDTHAHLLPWGPKDASGEWTWGGFSRLATLVGMNRMQNSNVMLLDAGDISVGDFMFQEYLSIAELNIMKQMGYDAMALGNHEFDLYPTTLMYELSQAGFPADGFPVLCANLNMTGLPDLAAFVHPYTIKEYGDIKVGIFALLTESANQISNPSPVVVLPAADEAQAMVDVLKGQGCDVVILLSHLGYDYDQMVASMTTGIDVIIGGHSHTETPVPVHIGQTVMVQTGAFASHLGKLALYLDNGGITGWDFNLIPVDQSVPVYQPLDDAIKLLAAGVEADPRFGPVYTQDIAEAAVDLPKTLGSGLFKDTPLGNVLADAFREKTGTDIAFQPQGFISQDIYAGPLRGADIFQAVPYGFDPASGLGFKLKTFKTTGMSIILGLEFAVYNFPYSEDFLLQSSGLSYAYNTTAEPGARVDYSSIMVNGQPLNPMGEYTVTASDAAVGFVGQIPGFVISDSVTTNDFVYTVARDYMVEHSPVVGYSEGRLIDLAVFADPVAGAKALYDVVAQINAAGKIDQAGIAKSLMMQLNGVLSYIQADSVSMAADALTGFANHVKAQSGKHIDLTAASELIYLANQFKAALMPSSLASAKNNPALPTGVELGQNYPNPFNPNTKISFSLPTASHVTLDIFNLLGQKVNTLIDADLAAGRHTCDWNSIDASGNRVASGVYFYRLSTGEKMVTKKMVLME